MTTHPPNFDPPPRPPPGYTPSKPKQPDPVDEAAIAGAVADGLLLLLRAGFRHPTMPFRDEQRSAWFERVKATYTGTMIRRKAKPDRIVAVCRWWIDNNDGDRFPTTGELASML